MEKQSERCPRCKNEYRCCVRTDNHDPDACELCTHPWHDEKPVEAPAEPDSTSRLMQTLNDASARVAQWPEWKKPPELRSACAPASEVEIKADTLLEIYCDGNGDKLVRDFESGINWPAWQRVADYVNAALLKERRERERLEKRVKELAATVADNIATFDAIADKIKKYRG